MHTAKLKKLHGTGIISHQNPPLPAHTAVPINLEHKCSDYYQNQDNVHGWHKQSAFPILNFDPVPEETNYNPAQTCVVAPISQQMQNLCTDTPYF